MRRAFLLALAAAVALAAGCTRTGGGAPVGASFDDGRLGAATAANHAAMTTPERYAFDLANRFAAEVDSTVTFAFDSAALDAEARATLARQAHWIRQFPEVRFRVFGHTDLVGSAAYNRALGLRRAQAVVHFLIANGVGRDRLEAVVSEGETRPIIVTQGRERRNRRTVTEVSGFVADHPMVLNGKYAEVVWRGYVASAQPASTLTGLTGTDLTAGQ